MHQPNEIFTESQFNAMNEFYKTQNRWRRLKIYRKLPIGHVDNIFFGSSIMESWPLHEFFPNNNILNRGVGGDTVDGLYFRMDEDIFRHTPDRVFMQIGLNGIDREFNDILFRITTVAQMMKDREIKVWLSSILPLRYPDDWNRFQYQDKIVALNTELKKIGESKFAGFLDYHSKLKDETGQLAAEFAQKDGTHITIEGYCEMAKVVEPHLK
ncbi:MAG: hypothetical protein GX811_03115 [Lentisphaerae bacterium]|jgi:lysophospholipase L1-like esterase|nr:hypothetical protein [Lentisphaerota bacterium]